MEAIQEVEQEALTYPQQARQITITNNEDYQRAANFLLSIKATRKKINESFDPIIAKAHAAHKEAVAQKKKVDEPLELAERMVKPLMAAYDTQQEQLRREEENRLREQAKKQEEERMLREAESLEKQGQYEAASEVIAQPIYVPPVVVAKTVPKISGVVFREIWKFRIIDASKLPREYLIPDEVKIGQVVRALKSSTNIAGVEAYAEKV